MFTSATSLALCAPTNGGPSNNPPGAARGGLFHVGLERAHSLHDGNTLNPICSSSG